MNINKLVKLAKSNSSLLAYFDKKWSENYGDKKRSAVESALELMTDIIIVSGIIFTMTMINIIILSIQTLKNEMLTSTMIIYIIFSSIIITMAIVKNIDTYHISMRFCKAISLLESKLGPIPTKFGHIERPSDVVWMEISSNMSGHYTDVETELEIHARKILKSLADEIVKLEQFPWKKKERDALRKNFDKKRMLLSCLLDEDFQAYEFFSKKK